LQNLKVAFRPEFSKKSTQLFYDQDRNMVLAEWVRNPVLVPMCLLADALKFAVAAEQEGLF